jgi:hypothetical protein
MSGGQSSGKVGEWRIKGGLTPLLLDIFLVDGYESATLF